MNEDTKFVCERLRQSVDDFVSLGRWGWGLLIVFLTQILIESAKNRGDLFKGPECGKPDINEIARGFLLVIIVAAVAYRYFLVKAKERIIFARTEVIALNAQGSSPGLQFAVNTAPTDRDLKVAMGMRMAIFGVLFVVWLMMFDYFSHNFLSRLSGLFCK